MMNPKQKAAMMAKEAKSRAKPNPAAPVGQGGRFAALKAKLAGQKGVRDPGGLAAFIGKKKYGTGPGSPFGQ